MTDERRTTAPAPNRKTDDADECGLSRSDSGSCRSDGRLSRSVEEGSSKLTFVGRTVRRTTAAGVDRSGYVQADRKTDVGGWGFWVPRRSGELCFVYFGGSSVNGLFLCGGRQWPWIMSIGERWPTVSLWIRGNQATD